MSELQLAMPPVFTRALVLVESMSGHEFTTFINGILRLTPTAARTSVVASLSDSLPRLASAEIAGLVEFAVSTRSLLASYDTDIETLAEAVIRAVFTAERKHFDVERAEQLRPRVVQLLGSEFIAKREKATNLAKDFETMLIGSRCYVDIRPVFANNGSATEIEGAVVVGTLRLETDDGAPMYMGVDDAELERLRLTVIRAQEKIAVVKALMSTAAIADLTPEAD